MKSLKTLAIKSPNQIGELLRKEFFESDTWDFQETVQNKLDENFVKDNEVVRTEFSGDKEVNSEKVHCHWYWEDDYYLEFTFDDGSNLLNTDAKKDYNWLWLHRLRIT